jgi:DNA primase
MVNHLLVEVVNKVLGQSKSTSNGNYAYHCPFCHHKKPKLEINFSMENSKGKNPWHCWTCNERGNSLKTLFKKVNASSDLFLEIEKLGVTIQKSDNQPKSYIRLPEEFIPFSKLENKTIEARHALSYLKKRGLSKEDIIKFNIGYCEQGKYQNMIIIPSYDKNGILNYFTARNFSSSSSKKYSNPPFSRDIIALESTINFDLPIILCEGMFDAIAIKRNVIPLLGKNIQSNLMKKLVESRVEKIYLALDQDAINATLSHCEMLLNEGKKVYIIDMDGKDPSEMGFEHFTKIAQHAKPVTFSNLFERKLNLL